MVQITLEQRDWIYFILRVTTIIVLYFNIFFVFPEEKRLYEECNFKTLCERGKLSDQDRECEIYLKEKDLYNPLIHSSYPEIIINNATENS